MNTFKIYRKSFTFITKSILFLLLTFSVSMQSCKTIKKNSAPNQEVKLLQEDTTSVKDSTEYELVVLDPGFESYLATQLPPNYHSQQYYESWNQQYVTEWNYRHDNPMRYGDFYETRISYDPQKDYGLQLNYRLYYYFQFIKDKYGIVLIDRGR